MPVCDLIMTFFLFFSIESLRVLFYTDKIDTLFIDLDDMGFLNEFTGIKYFMNDLQKKNYVLNLTYSCKDKHKSLIRNVFCIRLKFEKFQMLLNFSHITYRCNSSPKAKKYHF